LYLKAEFLFQKETGFEGHGPSNPVS